MSVVREPLRVAAPITQGLRDIQQLFPDPQKGERSYSEQVADYVEAKDEIRRLKDEDRTGLYKRLLKNMLIGGAVGAGSGFLKGTLWDRSPTAGTAANAAVVLGGWGSATAGAFTIARHILNKALRSRAEKEVAEVPKEVSVAVHSPVTREEAKEHGLSSWAPWLGMEAGAYAGAYGNLIRGWASDTPRAPVKDVLIGAGIGAGIGGLAGYLYRNYKKKQFLDHTEKALSKFKSRSAQQAVTEATEEKAGTPPIVEAVPELSELNKAANITLDIEKGDTLLGGKFKNVEIVVDEIGTDELGQPTVNGRKLLAYRIQKKMPTKTAELSESLQETISKLAGWPTKASNALKTRGMGGPPTRYSSGKGGAEIVQSKGKKIAHDVLEDIRLRHLCDAIEQLHKEADSADVDDGPDAPPGVEEVLPPKSLPQLNAELNIKSKKDIDKAKTVETLQGPVKVAITSEEVAKAADKTNTDPTDVQKENGKYKKGKVVIQDLPIDIENPKGSERSGTDSTGEKWSVEMPAHYGYIRKTEGVDGDCVDIYIGEEPEHPIVYVIDQLDVDTGKFDEHKAMLGFKTKDDALETYEAGFSDGRANDRMGAISELPVVAFKHWVTSRDSKKPMLWADEQVKKADAPTFIGKNDVLVFTPDGKLAVRKGKNRRLDLPESYNGTAPVPYEQPVQVMPIGGIPEPGAHGYQYSLQSAEGTPPEGYEAMDPQDALKELYAAMGKPENRSYQPLDRARARAIVRLLKRRNQPKAQ